MPFREPCAVRVCVPVPRASPQLSPHCHNVIHTTVRLQSRWSASAAARPSPRFVPCETLDTPSRRQKASWSCARAWNVFALLLYMRCGCAMRLRQLVRDVLTSARACRLRGAGALCPGVAASGACLECVAIVLTVVMLWCARVAGVTLCPPYRKRFSCSRDGVSPWRATMPCKRVHGVQYDVARVMWVRDASAPAGT